jgi:flagellar FliL protein
MAEKKPEAAEGAEAPKKKGKMMLFIIIGIVVLVLVGGLAAFFIMKKNAAAAAEAEDGEDPPAKSEKAKSTKKKDGGHEAAPVFYKFDKPFTVKLASEGQDNYLQLELQMRVLDAKTAEQLKAYDPELKHKITLLLLAKKAADLNNAPGVQKLSNEIREVANNTLEPPNPKAKAPAAEPGDHAEPDAPVQSVLFTTFIVQ